MMKKYSILLSTLVCFLLFDQNLSTSQTNEQCINQINDIGFPEQPKTVIDFEYINIAIGEVAEINPNCIPHLGKNSVVKFESFFSEEVVDRFISTYSTYQIKQLALVDLQTALSGISYWYSVNNGQFALENAKLYLIKLYAMIKSLQIYTANLANGAADAEQLNFVKSVIFNETQIIESYAAHSGFFGELSVKQNNFVKTEMIKHLNSLASISLLEKDLEYQEKIKTIKINLKKIS